jgi:hypothetical protein
MTAQMLSVQQEDVQLVQTSRVTFFHRILFRLQIEIPVRYILHAQSTVYFRVFILFTESFNEIYQTIILPWKKHLLFE